MKKYLSILAVVAVSASAFAQGTVNFVNGATSLVQQWTDANNQTLVSVQKGNGSVQLAYAPATAAFTPYVGGMTQSAWLSANPGWALGPTAGMAAAGRFVGGTVILNGVTAGTDAKYAVFGWNGTATSFDAALTGGGFTGFAGPFTTATGGAGVPIPSTPVSLAGTFTGITLTAVPEPSTIALAGLGAAAMLIFRRRK